MSNTDYSLARIADRMEIQDRLYQFSRGVDRRDWELVASVFHEDAIDNHGIYNGPVEGFIKFLKNRHETINVSMHLIGNIIVEFTGNDSALVETYCYTWQVLAADNKDMRTMIESQGTANPIEMIVASRYIDQFTRRGGVWRIQERQVVFESSLKVLPDAAGPDVSGVIMMGRRNESDFLAVTRAKLVGAR